MAFTPIVAFQHAAASSRRVEIRPAPRLRSLPVSRLASVYPIVSARALARPFTYEVPADAAKGAVVEVKFGNARRRGVVTEIDVALPEGVAASPVVRVAETLPPALVDLAAKTRTPLAGKDLKTGQTLIKTIVAPGLKARLLGVEGWYSTNILGNRDGEVLDDPESFKTKEESKKSVLDYILQPQLYPDLYEHLCHVVRINYYPPRGDNKEGWDNIDLVGWLGYPMQLKINFLCRDSILAAPIVFMCLRSRHTKSATRSTRNVQLARKYPNTQTRLGTPVNIMPR